MTVLFGMARRQTTGVVESLPRLVGLDCTVPDFSSLSRRRKTPAANIPDRGSKGPLHLLIDSTGIKVEGEGEWHARKHGCPKPRVWRKIRHGGGKETREIRAGEATESHNGDAPVLPDRLSQSPAHQQIGSVTADGACDTCKCHDAIADHGAHAVIPLRKNAKPWKHDTAGAIARNELLRAAKCLRRRRDETTMHQVTLLGQRLMARDFDCQIAELQLHVAVPNGFTALGRSVMEANG